MYLMRNAILRPEGSLDALGHFGFYYFHHLKQVLFFPLQSDLGMSIACIY